MKHVIFLQWTFSLDGVIVQPEYTYKVVVFNLPKPDTGDYMTTKRITIPGEFMYTNILG